MLWQKHIFCPNASIFIDFGYDLFIFYNKTEYKISLVSEIKENSTNSDKKYAFVATYRNIK